MRIASPKEGRQRVPHLGLGPAEIPPRDAARFGEEKAGDGRGTLVLAGGCDGGEISTPLGSRLVATGSETASRSWFGWLSGLGVLFPLKLRVFSFSCILQFHKLVEVSSLQSYQLFLSISTPISDLNILEFISYTINLKIN
jgi:hypothetical protein